MFICLPSVHACFVSLSRRQQVSEQSAAAGAEVIKASDIARRQFEIRRLLTVKSVNPAQSLPFPVSNSLIPLVNTCIPLHASISLQPITRLSRQWDTRSVNVWPGMRHLRSVSTTRVDGPSSRAELTARELGCIFWHPSTRPVNSGRELG